MKRALAMTTILMISSVCLSETFFVNANAPNQPGDGSIEQPFLKIQNAINIAETNDVVLVFKGRYIENLLVENKDIEIISESTSEPESTIIDGNSVNSVLRIIDSNIHLSGFTITNGYSSYGGGIYCLDSSPAISNCIITGNKAEFYSGGGIYGCDGPISNCVISGNTANYGGGGGICNCDGQITNCTFVGNIADYGGAIYNCNSDIINCIFVNNSIYAIYGDLPQISYCLFYDNPDGHWYDHEINSMPTDSDPCFVANGYWDNNSSIDIWVNGDYHLQSLTGRWDKSSFVFVQDTCHSPCIDTGDPNRQWKGEVWPDGCKVNIGAYGNTMQASMSLSNCGNIADLDKDGDVDWTDLGIFKNHWLMENIFIHEDLNRDGYIRFDDYSVFADNWYWTD